MSIDSENNLFKELDISQIPKLVARSQLSLIFEFSFTNGQQFFKNNEGNKWSVFGKALEGPRTGEVLKTSK